MMRACVEIDENHHFTKKYNKENDIKKDKYCFKKGISLCRYNCRSMEASAENAEEIKNFLQKIIDTGYPQYYFSDKYIKYYSHIKSEEDIFNETHQKECKKYTAGNKGFEEIKKISTFFNNYNISHQYIVDKYIIDMYFNDYKLAIEYDDDDLMFSHESYDKYIEYKQSRDIYIKYRLKCNIITVEYDTPYYNILDTVKKINKQIVYIDRKNLRKEFKLIKKIYKKICYNHNKLLKKMHILNSMLLY